MRVAPAIASCLVACAVAVSVPLANVEQLEAKVEELVNGRMERTMPNLRRNLLSSRKGASAALEAAVKDAMLGASDDPVAYCKQNPSAGCCKQIIPQYETCAPYFQGELDPAKLCPSQCAKELRELARTLPGSGEKDGVCAIAIQGVALVNLGCPKGTDNWYCYGEVNNIGALINKKNPSHEAIETSVHSICDSSGGAHSSCIEQIIDGQDQVYALMEDLLTIDSPWGSTDDQYPYDDDASGRKDDDAAPFNPMWTAQPIVRGLDLFCNRVNVSPLSPKQDLCLIHMVDNTTIFGADDDAQPVPSRIIEELADPCSRSFFASVQTTDPVALSVGSYGAARQIATNAMCGLATDFGQVTRNLTEFCASDAGGNSNVFDVLAKGEVTCAVPCQNAISAVLQDLDCCSNEVLFEAWYLGASSPIPTELRPPMDLWIQRIQNTCVLKEYMFWDQCGAKNPAAHAKVTAHFDNANANFFQALNETEQASFAARLCVHVERKVGAPVEGCKAELPPVRDPTNPKGMAVALSVLMGTEEAAAGAQSLLTGSPAAARAAVKFLERRADQGALYDASKPVKVDFSKAPQLLHRLERKFPSGRVDCLFAYS